jgi:hypothetical protein
MKILILLILLTSCVSSKSIHQQKLDTQWDLMLKNDKHMRRKMQHVRKRTAPHNKKSHKKYKGKYSI